MTGCSAEIVILIKYLSKRITMLDDIVEQIECHDEDAVKVSNVDKLSETRSAVRGVCLQQILDNYAFLWNLWQHTLHYGNLQTSLKSLISVLTHR